MVRAMDMAKIFNWLAQRPRVNYTLGELYQQVVRGRPLDSIDDNRLNFTRAGRAWERVHTAVGAMEFAIITGTASAPDSTLPLGTALVAATATLLFWKGLGVGAGKVVDHLVRAQAGRPQP